MGRNLECQWGKKSWQCAWGCMRRRAMRVRQSSACYVVAKILKCFKFFPRCLDLSQRNCWVHMRDIQFVWNYTPSSRLDRRATKWHELARHIAEHCGNKIHAIVRLALDNNALHTICNKYYKKVSLKCSKKQPINRAVHSLDPPRLISTAICYAYARLGYRRPVSVRLSVNLSVCHTLILSQN